MRLSIHCVLENPSTTDQGSPFGLAYFLFTQSIILEGLSRLAGISNGRKDVMKSKLPREKVFHYVQSMLAIPRVSVSVQNICHRLNIQ